MRWFFLAALLFFGLLYWQISEQKTVSIDSQIRVERKTLPFSSFYSDHDLLFLSSVPDDSGFWVSRFFVEVFIRASRTNPLIDFLFYRLYYSPADRQRILKESAFVLSSITNEAARLTWIGAFAEQEKLLALLPEKTRQELLTKAKSETMEFQVREHRFFISRNGDYLFLSTGSSELTTGASDTGVFLAMSSKAPGYFTRYTAPFSFFTSLRASVKENEVLLNFHGLPEMVRKNFMVEARSEQSTAVVTVPTLIPDQSLVKILIQPFVDIKFTLRRSLPESLFKKDLPAKYSHIAHKILQTEFIRFLQGDCRFLAFMGENGAEWRVVLNFVNPGASARAVMEMERLIVNSGGVFHRSSDQLFAFALPLLPRDLYLWRRGSELHFSDSGDFSRQPLIRQEYQDLLHVDIQSRELSAQLLPQITNAVEKLEFQSTRDCFLRMRQKDEVFMRCPDGPIYEMRNGDFYCPLHGSPTVKPPEQAKVQSYPELLQGFLDSFRQLQLSADFTTDEQFQLSIKFE
jgi:hypothetical protein